MGYRHAVIEEDDTLASDNISSTTVGPRCKESFYPAHLYTKRLSLNSIAYAYICRDFQSTSLDLVEPAGVTEKTVGIRCDILSSSRNTLIFDGIILQASFTKKTRKK